MEVDEKAVQRCCEWARSHGAQLPHIAIVTSVPGSRGVYASIDLMAGETVIIIPEKLLLTPQLAKLSPFGRTLLAAHVSDSAFLAAYLLDEREKGVDSFWKPYLDVIPLSFRHMPFFFEEQELSYLKGSLVFDKIRQQQNLFAQEYSAICECVPSFGSSHSLQDYYWSRAAVLSSMC